MWYDIIGIKFEQGKTDETENLYPQAIAVTVKLEGGEVKTVNPELDSADMRQLENLLRKKLDKLVNGG